MPLQTRNKVSDRELTFAVIAFPVSIVTEAGNVHILPARLVRAQSEIIIWIQNLSAHAAWLQLRDESLSGLVKSLSEEEHINVIQLLVQESRGNICQVGEGLQRVLVLLLELLETKDPDLLDEIFHRLLDFLVSADELKSRVKLLSSLYIICESSQTYKEDDLAVSKSLNSWYHPIIIS